MLTIDLPCGRDPLVRWRRLLLISEEEISLVLLVRLSVCLPVSHEVEIDLCFHFLLVILATNWGIEC